MLHLPSDFVKRRANRRRPNAPHRDNEAKPSEQLLIDCIADFTASRVLCTTLGRAQLAFQLAAHPEADHVCCHFLDVYQAARARQQGRGASDALRFVCQADFPEEAFDLAVLPFSRGGEAELTRDLMQTAHQRLRDGGRLVVAIDNPRDQWLHAEMQKQFTKVTRAAYEAGVVYIGRKRGDLKKAKDFECRFAFRDRGRLIHVVSRPGVFAHRRLDGGARALINTLRVEDGFRVLDMGCGSGGVSLAAAAAANHVHVCAIDSNARAVKCTERGVQLNELGGVTTQLDAEGICHDPGSFDLVLANPPYFSNYRIAEIFLQAGLRALKTGGRILLVSKQSAWYEARMPELFDRVSTENAGQYVVMTGSQRG